MIWQRVVRECGDGDRIEPILRDNIAIEGRSRQRIVDDDGHTGAAPEIREIPLAVQQRRHRREHRIARELPRAFPRREEKCLSPPDRTAERAAELVQPQRRLRRREVVLRVQRIVLQRLEQAAAVTVRPRSRRHRHDAAGRVAVLRGVVVGDHAEFLHRVDGKARQLLRTREADGVRGVAPVEDEILIARAAAGHGEDGVVLGSPRARVDHDDARRERRQ